MFCVVVWKPDTGTDHNKRGSHQTKKVKKKVPSTGIEPVTFRYQ